jgi:hypothetical protein
MSSWWKDFGANPHHRRNEHQLSYAISWIAEHVPAIVE